MDVAIASGIAYIADGSAGLQVINYRAFDNQGQASTVTIDSSVADFDSNTSGIQVIEGTTIPILTTVTDDVQVRDVELLVNGEVVDRDISFPFDFSVPTVDRVNETDGVNDFFTSIADRNISTTLDPGTYAISIFTHVSDDNTGYILEASARG